MLDERLMRVSFEVGGVTRSYEGLYMTAQGQKFGSPNQGECVVSIANLDREVRDQLITESSPFNRNPIEKTIVVEAGRRSTGLSVVYIGNIYRSTLSQPPDQIVQIRCLTGNFQKGNIVTASLAGNSLLSEISQRAAEMVGAQLQFEATDRPISNFTHNGSALAMLDKIETLGDLDVYLDDRNLVVKNRAVPLTDQVRVIGPDDIIGIPETMEHGVRVSFFYDNQTRLGGMLDLTSRQYPDVTGLYTIYKLGFDVANRDTPFYYTVEAVRIQ